MQFEHASYLWLVPPAIALLVAFFWWALRVRRTMAKQFVAARLLDVLTVGVSTNRLKVRMGLLTATVVLAILALARPQLGFTWQEARSRGLDVVVAIDTSRSMLATDVAPNRLRRAQLAAMDLKKLAQGDRLGLVAFAGGAFLQCPLTLDDEAFRQSVEALDVKIIPQGGTAVSEAIAAARGAFKEGNENHKVLVLLTDGEDHDGDALDSAKAAAKEGMRIFTIGVGTPNGEMLRTTDVQGRTEFIKDGDGNAVKSRLNDTLLRDMAKETGGFYMLLSGAGTVSTLYERGLAPLPKSDLSSQKIKRFHERYQWLLGLAIALLLAEMLVPERKGAKGSPVKQASVLDASAKASALLLLLGTMLIPGSGWASARDAMKDYRSGMYETAQAEFERMLQKTPKDARLLFNAGTTALQGGNFSVALDHLNAALSTTDVRLQQRIYYNLGSAQFRVIATVEELEKRQEGLEQSLKSFRNALALQTNDVDAKFNVDFVMREIAKVKETLRLREEARRAKEAAEAAVRQRNYGVARWTMEAQLKNNPEAKKFEDYTKKLQQIDEINSGNKP